MLTRGMPDQSLRGCHLPADRAARGNLQRDRLKGLQVQGYLEPSHALVDEACQMYSDNQLSYIEWALCTRRNQEVLHERKDKSM
eukprot:2886032-Amphidinium_carterae.1